MNNTMSYKGYTVSMIFDPQDKVIVGRVLDVDDIITFHGQSVSEFEINFRSAIDDYVSAEQALRSASRKTAGQRTPRVQTGS